MRINFPKTKDGGKATYGGRRDDFVRTLRALGAEIPEKFDPQDAAYPKFLQTAVCCSQERWQRCFGMEQNTTEHLEPSCKTTYLVWEHQCSDGLVLCVGRHHERAGGQRIVIMQAVSYF